MVREGWDSRIASLIILMFNVLTEVVLVFQHPNKEKTFSFPNKITVGLCAKQRAACRAIRHPEVQSHTICLLKRFYLGRWAGSVSV